MKDISSWLESRHQFLPVLQSPAFSEMEICKRLSLIAIIRVAKDQLLNWLPGPRGNKVCLEGIIKKLGLTLSTQCFFFFSQNLVRTI